MSSHADENRTVDAAAPPGPDSLIAESLARAGIYRMLGGAFGYPLGSRFPELAQLARAAAEATATPGPVREALTRFAAAAGEAEPGAVADEYVFLFDREVRCPPYESSYGEAPQMAGKAAALADVAGFYSAFGLAPAHAQPDMEDHIAAELEFMSALGLKEAYALLEDHREGLEVTRQAARTFLADHLGRWAEAFAEAIGAATPLPYYHALADLLATWARAETERLGVSPARLSGRLGYDPVQEEEAFTCPMVSPEPPAPPGERGD